MKFKNIIIKYAFLIVAFTIPVLSFSQTVGLFYNPDVPQIKFAANDIKEVLQTKGFTVEVLPLTSLTTSYANKKVVVALSSDILAKQVLSAQGGALPTLGEQAFALRTTTTPQTTYWVIGGDAAGAMYGGLELSEIFSTSGFSGTYNIDEKPFMLNRGIKLNMPFDVNVPTYSGDGSWESPSHAKAIPHVWDMTFWKKLIDIQARNRYNVLSVWVHHPFPALVKLDEWPLASLPKITGKDDGFSLDMNHNQRVAFWREVMRYAMDRGMKFYFFNWNVETNYARDQYPNKLDEDATTNCYTNPDIRDYTYKCMYKLLETYPELTGFGISAGDAMGNQKGFNDDEVLKTQWTWETMGKAVKDFLVANPSRKFHLIHRGLGSSPDLWNKNYAPLLAQPNAINTYSVKYASGHMYANPNPTWNNSVIEQVRGLNQKTWLTVRNDDYFYLHWGDPQFARDFMKAIPNLNTTVTGMYIGSDMNAPTRTFWCKNPDMNGQLEVERRWYMEKVWGRISYNPNTSDDVFKKALAARYPSVSTNDLFLAWSKVSRTLPKVSEMIIKNMNIDIKWWPEGCNNNSSGFISLPAFADQEVPGGSNFCDIATSATGNCISGKKSSYTVADEMKIEAQAALDLVATMNTGGNADLQMAITNIKQMAYLGLYYAHKIKGATDYKAGKKTEATDAMSSAYCYWMAYTRSMANEYTGVEFRSHGMDAEWKKYDAAVLNDYKVAGGTGIPDCNLLSHTVNLSSNNNDFGTVTGAGTFPSGDTVTVNAVAKPDHVFLSWTQYGKLVSTDASYSFPNYCDVNLVANFKSLNSCDVPYSNIGFTVNNNTVSKTIASLDISCAKAGAKLTMEIQGLKVASGDYCKIYYKLDDATQKLLYSSTSNISLKTLTVAGLKGNKLDIIVDINSTVPTSFYYLKNIKVVEDLLQISLKSNGCAGSAITGGGIFNIGDTVKVKATPTALCSFVNWTEGSAELSKDTAYTFTASKSMTLQANFKQNINTYQIALSTIGCAGNTVSGGGTFNEGDDVTVSAVVGSDCRFVRWTENGIEVSKNAVYKFVATQNRNLEAKFTGLISKTQTITFPEIPTKTYGDADFNPGATANSGLAVTYTSSNTKVATIVSGNIHIVGDGTSIITASQAGDFEYNAATSVNQTLTVNPAPPCSYPWSKPDFTITSTNKLYTSGPIDISCAKSVTLSLDLTENCLLEVEDTIYVGYKINGGALVSLYKKNNDINAVLPLSAAGLTGSTIEIIIRGTPNAIDDIYSIANLKIVFNDVEKQDHIITLTSAGCTGSTVSGGGLFLNGTTVSVTANVASTCSFINWTENGIEVSKNSLYTFVATQNRNLEANFSSLNSINDIENKARIYPNPVSKTLHIDFTDNLVEKEISIINSVGQMVYKVKTKDSNYVIDVSLFQLKGMVVLKIISGNKVQHHSVLIK